MKPPTKQLIVGQGLAGSVLALELLQAGQEVTVVSADLPYSASRVAAGILNPVTGKRLALSWKYKEFFNVAKKQYQEWDVKLGGSFFQEMPLLRCFQNEKEIAAYEKRKQQAEFSPWLGERHPAGNFGDALKDDLGSFSIQGAAVLDTCRFVDSVRAWLQNKHVLIESKFSYLDLNLLDEGVWWNDELYERVIFCEGYRLKDNPWFGQCPLELAAGEIQTLRVESPLPPGILNAGKWIRPMKNGQYLAGATYQWDQLESPPNEEGRIEMEAGLARLLKEKPVVAERHTGIRPVIKDRRPILGSHPANPRLLVLNGLGSKGSLMAPLLAKQLAEVFLINGKKLHPEVDVVRFSKFFV